MNRNSQKCTSRCTAKPYFFLVNDTAFLTDTPLRFIRNLFRRISKVVMTTDEKTKDEKKQYNVNREAAKKYRHCHQTKLINMNIS